MANSKDPGKKWGKRPDGTKKGPGHIGKFKSYVSGDDMTEYSIGVEINGKETLIPTLIPGLTDEELSMILQETPVRELPDSLVDKAITHAKQRMSEGKGPFKEENEMKQERTVKNYSKNTKNQWEKQFGGILQKLEQGGSLNYNEIAQELKRELDSKGMNVPKKFDVETFLKKYQGGGPLNSSLNPADENDDWIRKIMQFEFEKGSPTGTSMSNYGYNSPKGYYKDPKDGLYKNKQTNALLDGTGVWKNAPKSIDDAVNLFKQEYLPDVSNLPLELRQRVGDFSYNTGRDYRVYLMDAYLRNTKGQGLNEDLRKSFNKDIYNANEYTPEIKSAIDAEWDKYKNEIEALGPQKTSELFDQGRHFYYSHIDQVTNPKTGLQEPNPTYWDSYQYRADLFNPNAEALISPKQAIAQYKEDQQNKKNNVSPEGNPVKKPEESVETAKKIEEIGKTDVNTNLIPDYLEQGFVSNLDNLPFGPQEQPSDSSYVLPEVSVTAEKLAPSPKITKPIEALEKPKIKLPKINIKDTSTASESGLQGAAHSLMKVAPIAKFVGQIANWGVDSLKQNAYEMTPMERDYNPYTMKMGGMLDKYKNGGPINNRKLTEDEIKWIATSVRGIQSADFFSGKFPDNTVSGGSSLRMKNLTSDQRKQVQEYMKNTDFGTDLLQAITPNIPTFNPKPKNSNLEMGGALKKYTDGGTMPGSKTFIGPTHEEGGIPVNENGEVNASSAIAEVENDEFMHKFSFIPRKGNYIFSKALGTADMAEELVDKYSKKKGKHANPLTDNLSKQQMEFELKQIADLNDMRKAMDAQLKMSESQIDINMADNQMRLGGILGKILKQYAPGGSMTEPVPDWMKTPNTTGTANFIQGEPTVEESKELPVFMTTQYGDIPKGFLKSKEKKDRFNFDFSSLKPYNTDTTADLIRTGVLLGDTMQALRPAEKESPILAEYAKARGEIDSMSADLTQSKNAAVSVFNEASDQLRNTSPSIQSYISRKMGLAATQANAFAEIAAKEREMRNSIAQAKGSFEQAVASDIATRRYQNRIDNLQNKAAKEAYIQRLGQNALSVAKDLDKRRVSDLKFQEGTDFMRFSSAYHDLYFDKKTGTVTTNWRKQNTEDDTEESTK